MFMRSLLLGGSAIPATPSLPAASDLICKNNTAGTGFAGFQFNYTAKTAHFSASSSLGVLQDFTVTYFAAGDSVNPADYEINASISSGPTAGSNWSLMSGSAALSTWHSLGSVGIYNFQCSGRRTGDLTLSVTIRHKISTAISSTRIYTLKQQSDAVVPSFGGGFGNSISLSVLSGETFGMGFYIDNASAAGGWMLRSYRNGTYIQGLTGSYVVGGLPESEYQISVQSATNTTKMPFFSGSGGGIISDKRSLSAGLSSGIYYAGSGSTGSGSATLVIRFQHITDQTAYADLTVFFSKLV